VTNTGVRRPGYEARQYLPQPLHSMGITIESLPTLGKYRPYNRETSHTPGSVAEMRDPNNNEGMMEALNPEGIGKPVRVAKGEPYDSAPLSE